MELTMSITQFAKAFGTIEPKEVLETLVCFDSKVLRINAIHMDEDHNFRLICRVENLTDYEWKN